MFGARRCRRTCVCPRHHPLWYGPTIIRIATNKGELVVEVDDQDIEVSVKQGSTVVVDRKKDRSFVLTAKGGEIEFYEAATGVRLLTKEFTLERGGKTVVRAREELAAAAKNKPLASVPAKTERHHGEWVSLFNGEDLTGWEGLAKHWRWQDGMLVGTVLPDDSNSGTPHTYLCSPRNYEDFELRFQVRLKDGKGNSGLQFRSEMYDRTHFRVRGPQADIGPGYWGGLIDQEGAGVMIAAPKAVLAKVLKPLDFNDYYVKCTGKHVTIKINGATTVDDEIPALPTTGIIAWQLVRNEQPMEVAFKNIEIRALAPTSSRDTDHHDGEWVSLINGKDLTGWKVHPEHPGNWRVEKGVLIGSSAKGYSYLFSEKDDYADFHIRIKAKVNAEGNSGLYFRTGYSSENDPKGYGAQISHQHEPYPTGSLYNLCKAAKDLRIPGDAWFVMEVTAKHNHIVIKVNDQTTVDFIDKIQTYTSGHFAIQCGDPQTVIQVASIEVKRLSAAADPDRAAAEWVLKRKGRLGLTSNATVTTVEQLPKEPFVVHTVEVPNEVWRDEDLEQLAPFKMLQHLRLSAQCTITDAGIERFTRSPAATHLYSIRLVGSEITDAGVAHFRHCTELASVVFGGPKLTDAVFEKVATPKLGAMAFEVSPQLTGHGLRHLKQCVSLGGLALSNSNIDDAGFAELGDLPQLTRLNLAASKVGDAGLKNIARFPKLRVLLLEWTQVSDAGLAELKGARNLEELVLGGPKITDAGLPHLAAIPKLKGLRLEGTKVTAAGVAALQKALPKCKIKWDGGTIEPSAKADAERRAAAEIDFAAERKAAEGLLALGKKVSVTLLELIRVACRKRDKGQQSGRPDPPPSRGVLSWTAHERKIATSLGTRIAAYTTSPQKPSLRLWTGEQPS
jgi:hypothetical protein